MICMFKKIENPRTKILKIRLTKQEHAEILRVAKAVGLSRAAFIRRRALGHQLKHNRNENLIRELLETSREIEKLCAIGRIGDVPGKAVLQQFANAIKAIGFRSRDEKTRSGLKH